MSVLIKDMEMPNNCDTCNFYVYRRRGYHVCVATPLFNAINIMESNNGRRDFCPLAEIKTPYGDLIDKERLYERTAEWEAQALEQASKLAQTDNTEEWRRWSAILNERTAFKFDVIDAPVVIKGNME